MQKHLYQLALILCLGMCACVQARKHPTFVVLGDSYSTFSGYTQPEDNAQWYPADKYEHKNDVNEVEQTWWRLFAKQTGYKLLQNNSYSGSTICYDGYSEGTCDQRNTSFCLRAENLKRADYTLIFGGTNDSWCNAGMGNYKYADWTEKDKETFRPALAYLIDYIKNHNKKTKIVFILNTELKEDINESVKAICTHYNVPVVGLSNIDKQWGHPSIKGMETIAEQVGEALK